jgi:hypothetical protein
LLRTQPVAGAKPELLDPLLGAWKTVVDKAAIPVSMLVKISNCGHADVSEAVTKFLEILFTQDVSVLAIRDAWPRIGF